MVEWLLGFLAANPIGALIISVISVFRLIFKPLCTLIQLYVDATPSDADNRWWASVEDNRVFKTIAYLCDYFLSIKLPTAAVTPASPTPSSVPAAPVDATPKST